jgi:hypothetical protein
MWSNRYWAVDAHTGFLIYDQGSLRFPRTAPGGTNLAHAAASTSVGEALVAEIG